MRLIYTQPARAQIRHILADIYADSPTAAANLALRIEKAEDLLQRYPHIG